ncbi:MAG TPA: VCBS repeat-containing protein, partial [Acidimicrobiales bacterium]|nr:VCBS repeat-containing protein [Acidimicrobiales bacterium]
PNWTGGVNVAAGDLDDDGKAEVAVGPWQGGGPHLRLFNHDGTLRNGGIFAGNPNFAGGLTVAIGDLESDGKAEIIVGAMTQFTGVRGYRADLTPMGQPNFVSYEGFGGGVFVAIGRA